MLGGLSFTGFEDEGVIRLLRDLASYFPAEYAQKQGKPRWAEKTAFDAFHIPQIERLCGDEVIYLCVVRHALEVASSCTEFVKATGVVPTDMHKYVQHFEMPLEAYDQSWVDLNTDLIAPAEANEENCALVRYEDLLQSPEVVLRDILELVGEEYEDAILSTDLRSTNQVGFGDHKSYQKSGTDKSNLETNQKAFPPYLLARLAQRVFPLLNQLGYDEIEADSSAPDTNDARRR